MSHYKQCWLHRINQYVSQCCWFFLTYKVNCKHAAKKEEKKKLNIKWLLRYSPCANEYHGAENDLNVLLSYLDFPAFLPLEGLNYPTAEFMRNVTQHDCGNTIFWLPFQNSTLQTAPTPTPTVCIYSFL